jgi:hypothetical protein
MTLHEGSFYLKFLNAFESHGYQGQAKAKNHDASHSVNDFHVIINVESKVIDIKLPEYHLTFEYAFHVTEYETHLL